MRHVLTRADDRGPVIITRRAYRRPLLVCGHVRRVIIAFLGRRMLLEDAVDGHLHPIQRSRCGVRLLGPRKNEIAHLAVLMFQVGGPGGEVYQIAVRPRGGDYHCDQTGSLEHDV